VPSSSRPHVHTGSGSGMATNGTAWHTCRNTKLEATVQVPSVYCRKQEWGVRDQTVSEAAWCG
jgi:hypothetical protein